MNWHAWIDSQQTSTIFVIMNSKLPKHGYLIYSDTYLTTINDETIKQWWNHDTIKTGLSSHGYHNSKLVFRKVIIMFVLLEYTNVIQSETE